MVGLKNHLKKVVDHCVPSTNRMLCSRNPFEMVWNVFSSHSTECFFLLFIYWGISVLLETLPYRDSWLAVFGIVHCLRVGVMNQSGDYMNNNISASSPALTLTNTCQSYHQAWSYSTVYDNRRMLPACAHLWQFCDPLCSRWRMAPVFVVSFSKLLSVFLFCFPLFCWVRLR